MLWLGVVTSFQWNTMNAYMHIKYYYLFYARVFFRVVSNFRYRKQYRVVSWETYVALGHPTCGTLAVSSSRYYWALVIPDMSLRYFFLEWYLTISSLKGVLLLRPQGSTLMCSRTRQQMFNFPSVLPQKKESITWSTLKSTGYPCNVQVFHVLQQEMLIVTFLHSG